MNDINESNSTEYLYKEYTRLTDKIEALGQSSFNDFKLLAAIGVLLAWKPIAESELIGAGSSNAVLLVGFLGILLIIAVIATRDLLKQSVMQYFLRQVSSYEAELRSSLNQTDAGTFNLAEEWEQWERQRYVPLLKRFYLLFVFALTLLPTTLLALQEPRWCAAIYFVCVLFALAIYGSATRFLGHEQKPTQQTRTSE